MLVWPLATCRCLLEKKWHFPRWHRTCCSGRGAGASLGAWLASCLFLRHPMRWAITHLLYPHQCPWCPWFCHFTSAEHFPQRADGATEGPWGSLASMCYWLAPWETGCLGVEIKGWSAAGNQFMPSWMPTVNAHSHPRIIITCAVTADWRVSMDWPSSIFIHTSDKNTDDLLHFFGGGF